MANSVSVDGYLHIDGFDKFDQQAFNKRQIRAGMRKVGKLVRGRAQMNLALSGGRDGYPVSRTGATVESINFKLSRAGVLVRVSPTKTERMDAFYPAYLHYGVRQGARIRGLGDGKRRRRGQRQSLKDARRGNGWRITPRDNYMTDALADSRAQVQSILRDAFSRALLN